MNCMQSGFPTKKQIERELAILNTPTYQEARDRFSAYVRQLQLASTATRTNSRCKSRMSVTQPFPWEVPAALLLLGLAALFSSLAGKGGKGRGEPQPGYVLSPFGRALAPPYFPFGLPELAPRP